MTPLFDEDSLGAKAAVTFDELGSADDELIEDPEALAEAQAEVNAEDPEAVYEQVDKSWQRVFGPTKLQGILDVAGRNACVIAMPLAAEGIQYAWEPYPPEEMPGATTPERSLERPFSLWVAPGDAQRALELLGDAQAGSSLPSGITASYPLTPAAARPRRRLAWILFLVFLGVDLLMLVGYAIMRALGFFHFLPPR